MDRVDDRSGWSLHRDPDQPTERQHVAHTAGIPSARSKVGSQEWTEAGLHVGEKKIQPFERPHTPLSCLYRIAHRVCSPVSWLSLSAGLFFLPRLPHNGRTLYIYSAARSRVS